MNIFKIFPDNRDEVHQLINCVTTNKTSFFQESHHFDYLANTIVPKIRAATPRGASQRIRVWSAACSTGKEPYSIAITLLESVRPAAHRAHPTCHYIISQRKTQPGNTAALNPRTIEVVASDIDTAVLAAATRAIYNLDSLGSVPRQLWEKYFLRGKNGMEGQVKVRPEVAHLVEFKRINLMDAQWPLDGQFDVIFFRNALIYFKRETQDMF
jgi:chemotaxis protein methyltransferase CheR